VGYDDPGITLVYQHYAPQNLASFIQRKGRGGQASHGGDPVDLAAGQPPWGWPTIAGALTTKHHWLVIGCCSCGNVIEMDLTMKRRDADDPIRVALKDVRCPRCKGHKTRVLKLSRFFSIIS
jgi:hypothetical protein